MTKNCTQPLRIGDIRDFHWHFLILKKLTMEVTTERLHEIRYLLQSWLDRDTTSLKEIQSFLGNLNFIAACVRTGRICIARMLQWLKVLNKEAHPRQLVSIPQYVQKDVLWWHKFLPLYNGVSLMFYEEWSEPDMICSSDAFLLFVVVFVQENFPIFFMQESTILPFLRCLLS